MLLDDRFNLTETCDQFEDKAGGLEAPEVPDGRLTGFPPAGLGLPIRDREAASIDPLRPKEQHSRREQSDGYFRVVSILNGRWRVVICKDEIQWILQKRRRDTPVWDGASYCRTRQGLLRCIREKVTGDVDSLALAIVEALPTTV